LGGDDIWIAVLEWEARRFQMAVLVREAKVFGWHFIRWEARISGMQFGGGR
jgi:hypothetical protein